MDYYRITFRPRNEFSVNNILDACKEIFEEEHGYFITINNNGDEVGFLEIKTYNKEEEVNSQLEILSDMYLGTEVSYKIRVGRRKPR